MNTEQYYLLISIICTLTSAKPIMVTFGTNQGPIVPKSMDPPQFRSFNVPSNPAPVSEETEDIPPPPLYKPLPPHQYRTKLYSLKPPSSLTLGTPLDQKYTPSIPKFENYLTQRINSLGVNYRGPHQFERQEYEFYDNKKYKTALQPSVSYTKPHYTQNANLAVNNDKYVPQIGIINSSGVRYYIPQLVQYNNEPAGEEENSVYDKTDLKYSHYQIRQ